MRKVVFSPEAIADLEDIWLYIAQDSPAHADNFLDKLYTILPHSQRLAREESILTGKYQIFPLFFNSNGNFQNSASLLKR